MDETSNSVDALDRPRFFRDPIHQQIRFKRVNLADSYPVSETHDAHVGWLIPNLINTRPFQRLRHIRQNGLCNLVFHGMEHSRFSHSIGVSFMAGEMYDRTVRNSGLRQDDVDRLSVVTAGLLHDVGHAPFSHTMEEVLELLGIPFHHERMTVRIILENEDLRKHLEAVDSSFPDRIAKYIDKKLRDKDHWTYRLVSSQLDADRLDYLVRDARNAGLVGHGFDMPRLLDMLYAIGDRIVVDRHATEAVEAYLVMLYHMYQAVYFHRGVRGATVLLSAVIKRAADLHERGEKSIFPKGSSGSINPFRHLIEKGDKIDIDTYLRLSEFHLWQMIEDWQYNADPILGDLARRVMRRQRFRAKMFVAAEKMKRSYQWQVDIAEIISKELTFVTPEDAHNYYLLIDDPDRVGYKLYNWGAQESSSVRDESIWLIDPTGEKQPNPIENESNNGIFNALKDKRYYHRLMFPTEVYDQVIGMI